MLNDVCDKLGLPQFRRAEMSFIAEYVTVMKPLAQALDILQSETKAYVAHLVPTIAILKFTTAPLNRQVVDCRVMSH